jgi:hypothetical protein
MKIIPCSPDLSRKIRFWIILIVSLSGLFILFSPMEYLFTYFGYEQNNGCSLLTLTGIPCPACGLGRTFVALVTLDLKHLFFYNPAGPFFYLISGSIIISLFLLSFLNKTIVLKPALLRLWWLPVLLLFIVWILNIRFGNHV